MPKMKTNRGAAKRFKTLSKGGFKHRCSNRNHILTKKSQGRKRGLRAMTTVHGHNQRMVKRMLKQI